MTALICVPTRSGSRINSALEIRSSRTPCFSRSPVRLLSNSAIPAASWCDPSSSTPSFISAVEIDDGATDGHLPSELQASAPAISQPAPEAIFSARWLFSHLASLTSQVSAAVRHPRTLPRLTDSSLSRSCVACPAAPRTRSTIRCLLLPGTDRGPSLLRSGSSRRCCGRRGM